MKILSRNLLKNESPVEMNSNTEDLLNQNVEEISLSKEMEDKSKKRKNQLTIIDKGYSTSTLRALIS